MEILRPGTAEVSAAVRNLRGPGAKGARFHRTGDGPVPIDLRLVDIEHYGRPVGEVPVGHTALITLRGTGVAALRAGLTLVLDLGVVRVRCG